MPTFAQKIEASPEARKIMDSDLTVPNKMAQLAELGIGASDWSIRNWIYRKDLPLREDGTKALRGSTETAGRLATVAVPKGWEPYSQYTDKIGEAIVRLPAPGATERDLLITAGFDPDSWRIKGSVNTRKWMRYDQEWLYYYKFDVEAGESYQVRMAHVDELVKLIRKRPKPSQISVKPVGGTYTHILSDWQIGKAEGGLGTEDTVRRYKDCLEQVVTNIKNLRRMGVQIDKLAILSVGDLVEGCGDHYEMQQFSVDCDRRKQNRIVRELLYLTIDTLAPMFSHTTIAVIAGNHGEHRKDGKAFTTFADNDDVANPEAVKEAYDKAGWDMLEWHIPNEELSMCIDLGGVKVGLVHGHQFRGGVNALKKAEDWWRVNDFGLQPVREVQVLFSGHFHHYSNTNITHGRSWMQAPTIDPGSKWYTDTSGVTSIPGVLNLVITPDHPLGYDHLRVISPRNDFALTA